MTNIHNSIPNDVAFEIASLLQVLDLCALGSCSRFWWELCRSDRIWAGLCRDRWPALALDEEGSSHSHPQHYFHSTLNGWRDIYVNKHQEMAKKADAIIGIMEQSISLESSMEVNKYLGAIQKMKSMEFGVRDVEFFFLKENLHVLLNLAALHYCISWLRVQDEYMMEALSSSKICDRQVCVQWWKLGRWSYGFRLRDESISRKISLRDVAMSKGHDDVLEVLRRGAIHEVIRVQISAAKPTTAPWSCQTSS